MLCKYQLSLMNINILYIFLFYAYMEIISGVRIRPLLMQGIEARESELFLEISKYRQMKLFCLRQQTSSYLLVGFLCHNIHSVLRKSHNTNQSRMLTSDGWSIYDSLMLNSIEQKGRNHEFCYFILLFFFPLFLEGKKREKQ